MVKKHRVGIYVRLSKEDAREGQSVSIENQKLMLAKHVKEMGWELTDVYQDDGWSGTNQNRPDFQRMLNDVKAGRINTILIKDLSRLGRNYLEVGNLAEVFLPAHGCELISLNEKLDDMMVFRNWFNEQHSKSTSIKVKAGKRASAQNGKYVGTYAPYGYRKSPENRHKLVRDARTAPIVKRIFEMRSEGYGYRGIAAQLNKEGITSPREYYYQSKNEKNPTCSSRLWNENTIKGIVTNEAYIGNLVHGKYGTASYKNPRKIRKNAEEQIRVEGTHEPLVAQDLWQRVQTLAHKKYRPSRRRDNERSLFAGLLYCADCGFRLRSQVERRARKDGSINKRISYICSTYGRSGKNACTIHSISENALVELVAENLHTHARVVPYDELSLTRAILSQKDKLTYRSLYQNELVNHMQQIKKLDIIIENLSEDKAAGLIPASLYKRQIAKYELERADRAAAIKVLEARVRCCITEQHLPNSAGYVNLETPDADALLLLIDKIVVHEAQICDAQRVCNIEVFYNFVNGVQA